MYNPEHTKEFYNTYGEWEWSRLETAPYGRLQAIIHSDFIQRYVKPRDRVLDAGSGPGRFSILATRIGAKVSLLDISPVQLNLARQKFTEAGLAIEESRFIEGDIINLSMFPSGYFDTVICFGGALSYVCERRFEAAAELIRVTQHGGIILASVMSQLGTFLNPVRFPPLQSAIAEPDQTISTQSGIWQTLKTGDLPGFISRRTGTQHPPMHTYKANELRELFKDCEILEVAGSNVLAWDSSALEQAFADSHAWSNLIDLERKLNSDPGLVNGGTHIILAARR